MSAESTSSIVSWGVADRQLTNKESWVSFWTLFIFGFATVSLLFKASPVLTDIGAVFGMDLDTVGWVSSVFAIASLVVSFPGAWIMRKFGIKSTLTVTLVVTIVGSLMGVFESSLVPTIVAIITIPTGILFGIIADKTNTRKWFLAIGYFVFAIIAVTLAYTGGEGSANPWVFAVILGCVAGAVPMATRAFIPVLVRDPDKVDYALAVMAFTTWLGQLLVGFYGGLVATQGFYGAALTMMLPMLVVAGIVVAVCRSDKKILSEG